MQSKFYKLTPETGDKLRESNLTASEWKVWSYLVEVDPWGDRYQELDTLTLLSKCRVSKATFYRAIAKLEDLGLFDFQDNGFNIRNMSGVSSLTAETEFSSVRKKSQPCENGRSGETKKSGVRKKSQPCENKPPEAAPEKGLKTPQTLKTIQTKTDTTDSEENCCVLKMFEEELKMHRIYLYLFDESSETKNAAGRGIAPNPKISAIAQIIKSMPQEKAQRAIAAFLAWLPNAKNVRCKYAALASSLRKEWES